MRVTGGVHGVPVSKGQAERALNARQQIAGGVKDGGVFIHAVGKQYGQAHGVRNGFLMRLDEAALHGLLAQLQIVDQIAIVPKGNIYPGGGGRKHGLHVGPFLAAGGGIARVPHRYVSLEGRQGGFIKDIGHQAHVFEYDDAVIIAHRDAGGLLATVLQGEEPEVGQLGDFLPGSPNAVDAAFFAGLLLVVIVKIGDTRSMYFYHGVYISLSRRRKLTE